MCSAYESCGSEAAAFSRFPANISLSPGLFFANKSFSTVAGLLLIGTIHFHEERSMPTRKIVIPATPVTTGTPRNPLQLLNDLMQDEFQCPICLGVCANTHVNPDCSHRFCGECMTKNINECKHECPSCRAHIPTYRTLRPDTHFDKIVS